MVLPFALNLKTSYIESLLLQCDCCNGFKSYFGGSENEKKQFCSHGAWERSELCFRIVITSSVIDIYLLF